KLSIATVTEGLENSQDQKGHRASKEADRNMQCPHCRAVNEQADGRCAHCGRRLGAAPAPFPIRTGVSAAATAPALDPFPERDPAPAQPQETPNYQPSLFRDGSAGKVIPIPTLTPLHPYHRDAAT